METWSFVNNNSITLHVQFRIYRKVESGLAGWEGCNYNYLLSSALLNVISTLRSNNFDLIVLYHNISCEEISSFLQRDPRLYKPTKQRSSSVSCLSTASGSSSVKMSWKLNLIYDLIRRQFSTFLDLVNPTSLSFTALRTQTGVFAIFPPRQSPSHLTMLRNNKARIRWRFYWLDQDDSYYLDRVAQYVNIQSYLV